MGIQGLTKLLHERAPKCIKEKEMPTYADRVVAIDASMSIYQFVIAMRAFEDGESVELKNARGEVTTHLIGLWSRTIRMIGLGMKPVYVFDGKPPELKSKEIEERNRKAKDAQEKFKLAKEEGDEEVMEQMSKRTVRVSRDQVDECKTLLKLMGLPIIQAASEAEAQCVELVRHNKAFAVGTEDMDALTFGAPTLLRHLTFSESKKKPVLEISLKAALEGLGLTQEQFIDLCILMGCDYSGKIPGIGPMRAFEGIKNYGSLPSYIASLDQAKYPVPESLQGEQYEAIKNFFLKPDVVPAQECDLKFKEPDEEGLRKFLVQEKMFDASRVDRGIEKLKKGLQRKTQVRLDQWFKPLPKEEQPKVGAKRQASSAADSAPALKGRKLNTGLKKAVKK